MLLITTRARIVCATPECLKESQFYFPAFHEYVASLAWLCLLARAKGVSLSPSFLSTPLSLPPLPLSLPPPPLSLPCHSSFCLSLSLSLSALSLKFLVLETGRVCFSFPFRLYVCHQLPSHAFEWFHLCMDQILHLFCCEKRFF